MSGTGGPPDFESYVASRRAHLRRTAYLLCGDWDRAEDIVQGVTDDTSAVANLRLVRDGVGTFLRAQVDTPTSAVTSPLAVEPCVDAGDAGSCTVLMPWETAVLEGKPVASSVIQVEHPASASGQGYVGAYTTRTVVLVRGRTVLTILSDSRDVDATGTRVSSTAPALAIDELLPLARTMPLPYALQPAADSPLWTSKG